MKTNLFILATPFIKRDWLPNGPLTHMKQPSILSIFILSLTFVNQVKADDLSCLSISQKEDFEQRFQELMVKSEHDMKNPVVGEKYIEIQNQKNQALIALINCEGSAKAEGSQTNKCTEEKKNFNTLLKAEADFDLKVDSQSATAMRKVTDFIEQANTLRSQYPSCK